MGRKQKPQHQKVKPLPATVLPSLRKEIEDFASVKGWSVSKAASHLIEKGLEFEKKAA